VDGAGPGAGDGDRDGGKVRGINPFHSPREELDSIARSRSFFAEEL
jgi:hypothetical protein